MEGLERLREELGYFSGKKVFVTGHTGFKGSWLVAILKELGSEVFGFSLPPPTNPSLYMLANVLKVYMKRLETSEILLF